MTELEKFQKINICENADELAQAIIDISENGIVKGRIKGFDAKKMASRVKEVIAEDMIPNVLTREFGIRQQAIYIAYYESM